MKKTLSIFILLAISFALGRPAQGQERSASSDPAKQVIEKIYQNFEKGQYQKALKILQAAQENLAALSKSEKNMQGLLYYWKGLCYLRLNEYDQGIENLQKAIEANYEASDLYYEYGQALYASLKLRAARLAFKKSIELRHKLAVSMYYIGFISQELGDYKTAASFYNAIEKLPLDEKRDVVQAARMQLAEIYVNQIRKKGGSAGAIEEYVLPQYRKALEWDEESHLAADIKEKIERIERRYDLTLFQLRNGRPTVRPPYFLKANVVYNVNDNVNALGEEVRDSIDEEKVGASSIEYGAYGRYTFYPNSSFGVTPQFNFGYTDYLSKEPEITQNNGYFFTTSLQTAYEHFYNEAAATAYLDVDYTYTANDLDQDDEVEKYDTELLFTLSEQLEFWRDNPTIFRLRHGSSRGVDELNDKTRIGGVWEQMIGVLDSLLYFYTAYDSTVYANQEIQNNNMLTFRADALLPSVFGLFNPNLYASYTQAEYVEDDERGTTALNTWGININRPLGEKLFIYIDYSTAAQTGQLDSDVFTQQIMRVNLDYIF